MAVPLASASAAINDSRANKELYAHPRMFSSKPIDASLNDANRPTPNRLFLPLDALPRDADATPEQEGAEQRPITPL